jgi:hypothetical protein
MGSAIIRRNLLPRGEGHALRSDGDEIENQKRRSRCLCDLLQCRPGFCQIWMQFGRAGPAGCEKLR